MSCGDWAERIALYAGGDLDDAARTEVERHLAGCEECREFARGMEECVSAIHEARDVEIAAAHFAAVRARVLSRLRPASRHGVWRWTTAAAIALAMVAGWTLLSRRPELPPPQVALARPPAPQLSATATAAPRKVRRTRPPRPHEPLLVKIETDNQEVVIYWIAN
jgi:anti-sigma factor RsiW